MLDVLLKEETGPAEKHRILRKEFGVSMPEHLEREAPAMCKKSGGGLSDLSCEQLGDYWKYRNRNIRPAMNCSEHGTEN